MSMTGGGTLKIVKVTLIVEERRTRKDGVEILENRWQFDTGAGSHSLKTALDEVAVKQNEAVTRLMMEIADPEKPKEN
jgi:hypothetical protein